MPFTDWRRSLKIAKRPTCRFPRATPRDAARTRARKNRVDADPAYTWPHEGKVRHIGVGRIHRHKSVIMLVDGVDVRILTEEGEALTRLTLFRPRIIRLSGTPMCPRCRDTSVHDVLRHHMVGRTGFEPATP